MIYKLETQNKNSEKLRKKFEDGNVPAFIRDYFYNKESQLGAINYWIAIKDLLVYLLEEKIINKQSISEITPEDFEVVKPVHINTYLNNKEKKFLLSPTTLKTRKNIFKSFWEYLIDEDECLVKRNIIKKVAYKGISSSSSILVRKLPTDEQLKKKKKKINKKGDAFVRIRNLAVFHLLKGSGIREGELAGLDLSNLYLDEDIPYIKVIGKGKYREIEGRTVYLTRKAVIHIKEWLEVRDLY
ncbi:MAG: tyrosine-type recombinase/integrase [Ruminococcaceae bacterium]|nr:tyrosine-type recombinase/integrase [Oscillospiraceae bacterium]